VVLVQKCWRRRVARRKIHELGTDHDTRCSAKYVRNALGTDRVAWTVMHSRARFKVAEEIAVTEKNYVDILHTIIEVG